ncbi:MAG: ribosomal L7Ae/L30e/S12e/Gadd45 family protein [Clostridiales bacterium]|nr:ribosomal L7Ae/L30e/S12e/Gadd45 family protein [Clostridiales bacterium]
MNSKILTLLGFARKSNNVLFGFQQVSRAAVLGNIELIIFSDEVSGNTEKKVVKAAAMHQIKCIKLSTTEELSRAIGESNKSILGIKDKNFAKQILAYYSEENE